MNTRGMAVAAALAVSWCGMASADDLPLPRDAKNLGRPYAAIMGNKSVTIEGLVTRLSVEELRQFYLKALPAKGWRMAPPPWLEAIRRRNERAQEAAPHQSDPAYAGLTPEEKVLKAKAEMERALQEHPELAQNPEMVSAPKQLDIALALIHQHAQESAVPPGPGDQSQLVPGETPIAPTQPLGQPQTQAIEEMQQQQLYAARGEERLLLNFTPQKKGGTRVFANRWSESPEQNELGGPEAAEHGWPVANPCCSGEASVPPELRKLPSSVPRYPNGRMVSTISQASSGLPGSLPAVEMYLTQDSREDVLQFYRSQMAYNGWTEAEFGLPASSTPLDPAAFGPQASHVKGSALMFRKDGALCIVAVSEFMMADALAEALRNSGSPVAPQPISEDGTRSERTVVVVNYVDDGGRGASALPEPAIGLQRTVR